MKKRELKEEAKNLVDPEPDSLELDLTVRMRKVGDTGTQICECS
jgi:hypothetical protein